jgi:ATP-binding cassette, subfamily F, member 3
LLAAVLPVQQGERKLGYHVKAGYYAQNRAETLRLERTVLAEALDTPQRMTEQSIRTVLGTFGFRGDDVFKTIQVLSGGEKSRLALVKLLLDPPNLLLMDEPTTHLDIVGVEALVHALEQFSGTVIFISHDVYFIRRLANQVVRVFQGQLVWFKGDYQYYLDKSSFNSEREAIEAGGQPETAPEGERTADRLREQRRQLVAQQNERARRRRLQKSLVDKLEKEIHELEQRQGEITAQLQDPATYQKGQLIGSLNRELAELHDRLPALNTEWETAATLLAEIESESLE